MPPPRILPFSIRTICSWNLIPIDNLQRGLFTYAGLNLAIRLITLLSRGTIRPTDYDLKEYWTWKPAGEKPLVIRLFSRRGRDCRSVGGASDRDLNGGDAERSSESSRAAESSSWKGPVRAEVAASPGTSV